jgi:excisionase family DNA binding protein
MSEQTTRWLTLREAATHAKCSVTTIARAARSGELRGFKLRRRRSWRFDAADVDRWLKQSADPLPFAPQVVTRRHAS